MLGRDRGAWEPNQEVVNSEWASSHAKKEACETAYPNIGAVGPGDSGDHVIDRVEVLDSQWRWS